MIDSLEMAGASVLGMVLAALVQFFTFDRKFKRYINDTIGRRPESTTFVAPQPLKVEATQRLATHDELQHVRREFEQSQSDMAKQISDLGRDNEERVRRLHERIEVLQTAISAIPHQVIVLLRDTKGLHQ